MTSDDDRVEALRKRLDSIGRIVEERLTDDVLEARLRRVKERAGKAVPFHGRRALLDDLLALADGPAVLAGPGGAGKTTVATALAERVRERGDRVWWVPAFDPVALSQGLVAVARDVGGAAHDVEAIARGAADAADRFWRLLERSPSRWLLVFDEADDPRVLAAGDSPAGIQDPTGWVRPSAHGLALVTSRETDPRMWGTARLLTVGALAENDAARVLRELAPSAGDDDQAKVLSRRLGGHPLSLQLAGSYLGSAAGRGDTFSRYELEVAEGRPAQVVELSLEGLALQGIPQARSVLQLAGCYAATDIPEKLLDNVPGIEEPAEALRGLREVGLIRYRAGGGFVVHPVVGAAGRAGPHPSWIRHTAVDLLAADAGALHPEEPESWPDFLRLAPHLLSLLETTAGQVDHEHLAMLVTTAARIAAGLYAGGAGRAGSVLCERALAHGAALGDGHPAVLLLRHHLAWAVAERGDLAEAEGLYHDVLRGRLRLYGPGHPDVLRCRHELAWLAGCGGDWVTAEEGYRAVLRDSADLDPRDPDVLITRHELGWAIANQGRFDEARDVFRAVLRDRELVLGPAHQRTLATRHELAWITARRGDWAAAEAGYRELLAERERLLGADHPETLLTRHELAWIAALRGRTAEAGALYADVLDRRGRVLGDDHPQTRATREALTALRNGRIVDAHHLA